MSRNVSYQYSTIGLDYEYRSENGENAFTRLDDDAECGVSVSSDETTTRLRTPSNRLGTGWTRSCATYCMAREGPWRMERQAIICSSKQNLDSTRCDDFILAN
jgi:hypothetical protein